MMKDFCYLMDLERTLTNGIPCFWKGNKYGYTYKIEFAGIFPRYEAEEIAKHDLDEKTVVIPIETALKILGKEMKAHEGS